MTRGDGRYVPSSCLQAERTLTFTFRTCLWDREISIEAPTSRDGTYRCFMTRAAPARPRVAGTTQDGEVSPVATRLRRNRRPGALQLVSYRAGDDVRVRAVVRFPPPEYGTYFYYATLPLPGLLTSPGASMLRAREIPAAGLRAGC